MPPKKSNRKNNNPPPPPPQYDLAVFQVAVTATMAAAMLQINASGTSGEGSGANPYNLGESHGIVLTRWFEKTKSIFEICVCPETS